MANDYPVPIRFKDGLKEIVRQQGKKDGYKTINRTVNKAVEFWLRHKDTIKDVNVSID